MEKLHQDIVLNIVLWLPVKSLSLRCVSKSWCKLLKDPDFMKRHLSRAIEMNRFSVMMHPFLDFREDTHTLDYDPSLSTLSNPVGIHYPRGGFFGGTCNGLICLTTRDEDYLVLWNPATKKFKELPVPSLPETRYCYCKYAFGYDDKMDDFKILSFMGVQDDYRGKVHVYSLKSNSWRWLENIPYDLFHAEQLDVAQVSVNGAMHWVAETNSQPSKVILSFDFKNERFDTMPLPSLFLDQYRLGKTNLCSLGGSLCLQGSASLWDIDVWEMKDYGVTDSWAKLFTINEEVIGRIFSQLAPLQLVKDGEVLLGYDTDGAFHLDLYDLKSGTFVNVKAHATRETYSETTFVYVESLVPLNSGTYVGPPEIEDSKANARQANLDNLHTGNVVRVDIGDSGDDDDSDEEEEEDEEGEEEEIAVEFPPKSVNEAIEAGPRGNGEILDRFNHYVEE